jgi:hypothetical protein
MTTSAPARTRDRTAPTPVAPVVFLAPDLPDETAEDDRQLDQDRGTPSRSPFATDET